MEDNIVKPADGLAGVLALVELALGGYSQVVAHMPKIWRKDKNLNKIKCKGNNHFLHLKHKLL